LPSITLPLTCLLLVYCQDILPMSVVHRDSILEILLCRLDCHC